MSLKAKKKNRKNTNQFVNYSATTLVTSEFILS